MVWWWPLEERHALATKRAVEKKLGSEGFAAGVATGRALDINDLGSLLPGD